MYIRWPNTLLSVCLLISRHTNLVLAYFGHVCAAASLHLASCAHPMCSTRGQFYQHCTCALFFSVSCESVAYVYRAELPGRDINDLLQREPLMLTANIKFALQELKRLTPAKDPTELLFNNPGLVLSMDEQMMESTIDGDLTQT